MKVVSYVRYGAPEVLRLEEREKPVPGLDQVLIGISHTTVTAADCMMREADTLFARLVLGVWRPRKRFQVMGIELSGVVEEVGSEVERFCPGDRVYGFTGWRVGAYAEYICLSEKASLSLLPEELSLEEGAALVDGATTSIFFLRDLARIKAGDKVLIIGASGSIGTAAVQVAKFFGAHVTGVCSAGNLDLVRGLGADDVIDYTKQDYTKEDGAFDIIFDAVSKSTYARCRGALREGGRYLLTVAGLRHYLTMAWTRLFGRTRLLCGMSVEKHEALVLLNEMIRLGKIRPVIDRRYPLAEIPEAHRYVGGGHKRGNVVVQVQAGSR